LANRIAQPEEVPTSFGEMSEQEQSEYLTALWTTKEAIYKSLSNQAKIDVLTDISIIPFNINALPTVVSSNNGRQVLVQIYHDNIISVAVP
jgi:phosphopantetheinyl transferase (holo-ACP synthase)